MHQTFIRIINWTAWDDLITKVKIRMYWIGKSDYEIVKKLNWLIKEETQGKGN